MSACRTATVFMLDVDDRDWVAAGRDIPDPPPGWTHHLVEVVERSDAVSIASSRLGLPNGCYAVGAWLRRHLVATHGDHGAWVAGEVGFGFEYGRAA